MIPHDGSKHCERSIFVATRMASNEEDEKGRKSIKRTTTTVIEFAEQKFTHCFLHRKDEASSSCVDTPVKIIRQWALVWSSFLLLLG